MESMTQTVDDEILNEGKEDLHEFSFFKEYIH